MAIRHGQARAIMTNACKSVMELLPVKSMEGAAFLIRMDEARMWANAAIARHQEDPVAVAQKAVDKCVKDWLDKIEEEKKPTDWNDVMKYIQDMTNRRGVAFGMQVIPGVFDGSA